MNLFKKDPKFLFQIISAIILVVLSIYFTFLIDNSSKENLAEKEKYPSNDVIVSDKEIQNSSDILYIKLRSPSYAKSNFDVDPATKIEVYLMEPVNTIQFSQNFILTKKDSSESKALSYMVENRSEQDFGKGSTYWDRMWKQKIIFIPDESLSSGSTYLITVFPNYYNSQGKFASQAEYKYEFTTTDNFKFLNSNINLDRIFPVNEKIKITFTSPLDYDSLYDNIITEPYISNLDLQVIDKILTINNSLLPDTLYQITVPSNTEDLYNRKLGKDLIFQFRTSR